MRFLRSLGTTAFLAFLFALLTGAIPRASYAQSNSGIIQGTVTDPSKAVVPGAKVRVENPISGHVSEMETGMDGTFSIPNIPFNRYHMTATAPGFANFTQDVDVNSTVPVSLAVVLTMAETNTSITVTGSVTDLVEVTATEHTNVDRGLFEELPLESQSSSVSSLITLSTPGIVADSNGLFHGLGDHAENMFSVDGQPITDQQSKVFSNQIPADSIQSMDVIEGAPPAEYGGKTSVIVKVTTRSGLGVNTPHGEVTTSYGSFGTATLNANVAYGGQKWGNFISLGGLNTDRFLDPPEFQVLHDNGNEANFFDRLDFRLSEMNTIQLNVALTRSWFQTPNTWDQQLQTCTVLSAFCNGAAYASGSVQLNPITGIPLGPADQRSRILTFNIAPTWTRVMSSDAVFTLGAFVRHDQYNYYPSNDPFADYGPLQNETASQLRFLTNAGARTDWSYVKGIHNLKVGATYEQTFLTENDGFGIVNPDLLSGCSTDQALASECPNLVQTLAPYNLTTGGQLYHYFGHTDVKELALYAQDTVTKGPWSFNFGLRGDFYNGLDSVAREPEPRAGIAYNIKKTNTVLRISYARTLETPFNENLILSGMGCTNAVVSAIMTLAQRFDCVSSPLTPGFRNEFHAGLQQAFGKHFVLSGEYLWKYTHNAYDFNIFGASPITFPIEWHNSKIPGFAVRASIPNYHGLTAFIVLSHVAARFFGPTVSGIAPPPTQGVFRIDHDEVFAQTTHAQYQPFKRGPWLGFNWRYDSGLVSGAVPCLAATATCQYSSTSTADAESAMIPAGYIAMMNNATGLPLTADQEFQAGFTCNGVAASPTQPLGTLVNGMYLCPASQMGSTQVKIPGPGTENDDHNPQRTLPRNLFDTAVGHDNIFNAERYKVSVRFTVINLTNKEALYNFLSTFSGTHYVTPRTFTAEVGFHF